jgi:hypothetical protein
LGKEIGYSPEMLNRPNFQGFGNRGSMKHRLRIQENGRSTILKLGISGIGK